MPMRALALIALLFCTIALADAPARAVPTFESIGLYWKPGADPGPEGCPVRFRKAGAREWREGLPLWFDRRDRECRGSLVNLVPGTEYEIDLKEVTLKARTWSNKLAVAETVTLPRGVSKETLEIRKGGTARGYVLYQAHPEGTTIDVEDGAPYNVVIAAPFVILRGVVLKGAQRDAIDVRASDVVIEGNDISEWGRYKHTNSAGWKVGVNMDSGIRADCRRREKVERVVIQENRIHNPRYGANSWSWGHPVGPQAISFLSCGGNHVIRHNEIASDDPRRYFNDALGGEENFSDGGFPNRDSDIYRNRISGAWDDAIEAEGANMNVRIWGNAIDRAAIGIATAVTHRGPLYVFGNEHRHSRRLSEKPPEADDRGPMIKAGDVDRYGGGRRYIFDNKGYDVAHGISGSTKQPLTNTVSRNNEWKLFRRHWPAVRDAGGSGNDIQDGRKVRIPNFHESARGDNG
jgi:hypothetical protein